ncbi:LysM peptidoglycan-binding domain-containing protein [Saccharopolyspora sp. NFXS83]|uniref:LysM peptidoglycan-binding domain-containing protein n=1 Tax=Saccharopolyspora sp. NFXS83 TaxID=2993560 RepID=UPI00224B6CCC|nr:LysM peptidoglycan-binding domain-containing protein [Saccharopolyspora sp. NFXS83]MCX2734333.1 LysM peptidoglycan-binding domain-containing protein [Saccharopolyspora sp. NFXS83]
MTNCNTYRVQTHDTLSEIGVWFHVPWQELARINKIANPDHIEVGELLFLTEDEDVCNAYQIKSGDTLSELAERFHVGMRQLAHYNHILNPDQIQAGATLCVPLPAHVGVGQPQA